MVTDSNNDENVYDKLMSNEDIKAVFERCRSIDSYRLSDF